MGKTVVCGNRVPLQRIRAPARCVGAIALDLDRAEHSDPLLANHRRPRSGDDDPKRLVAEGYDAIAARFDEWQTELTGSRRMRYLADLVALLPESPDVLDLGSGAGIDSTRVLPNGFDRGRDLRGADRARPRARSRGDPSFMPT